MKLEDKRPLFSPNGIKAILFDLDGTLHHSLPSGSDVFADYVASRGFPSSGDDRQRALRWEHYYWANSRELGADIGIKKDENQEFWCKYSVRRLTALGLSSITAEALAPDVCQYMSQSFQYKTTVPAELPGVLDTLQKSGYRLGVVSNRDHPFWEFLQELGLCPFFDFSLAGGEVKSWKPEPGIFQAAIERANSRAGQTIYVGDNYFADVVGARRAGLKPVLYDPGGLFHEPGCSVITSFDELIGVIKGF